MDAIPAGAQLLPPADDPMWGGRETVFLDSLVPLGEKDPVDVVLDGREGSVVYLRRRDPSDPPKERVPVHPGDSIVLMTALSHASLNLTAEVGRRDDMLTAMRIVPVRRIRGHVYGRVLRFGEKDDGRRVHLRPGDSFTLSGRRIVQLDQIDTYAKPGPSGYAPLTDTIWTWFEIIRIGDTEVSRYVLAAARRLDAASRGFDGVQALLKEVRKLGRETAGPRIRERIFELIGQVETAIISLARAVDMAVEAPANFHGTRPVPRPITARHGALIRIRDGYEHIDERALGQVRRRPSNEALTIFDYRSLLERGRISYGKSSLRLDTDLPMLLRHTRLYIKRLAERAPVLTPR